MKSATLIPWTLALLALLSPGPSPLGIPGVCATAETPEKDRPESAAPRQQTRRAEAARLARWAAFLRQPWAGVLLVMVGLACLLLELKWTGVGVPGVIAGICFVLFFWSHAQAGGWVTWLAVVFFLAGLLAAGVQAFLLRRRWGLGAFGALLGLFSLGLAVTGRWPVSGADWLDFLEALAPFGFSLLGGLVVFLLAVRCLHSVPWLKKFLPRPPEPDEPPPAATVPPEELLALLGAIGVAATALRPAGKGQFGDAFVDVVSEEGEMPAGTRLRVVSVKDNRVTVVRVA